MFLLLALFLQHRLATITAALVLRASHALRKWGGYAHFMDEEIEVLGPPSTARKTQGTSRVGSLLPPSPPPLSWVTKLRVWQEGVTCLSLTLS